MDLIKYFLKTFYITTIIWGIILFLFYGSTYTSMGDIMIGFIIPVLVLGYGSSLIILVSQGEIL